MEHVPTKFPKNAKRSTSRDGVPVHQRVASLARPRNRATADTDNIVSTPSTNEDPVSTKSKDALKTTIEIGEEKIIPGWTSTSSDFAEEDPGIRDIPFSVRRIVSLEDDPTLPTLTFRFFGLTLFFIIPGASMSPMSHFRTAYIPHSVFFVQIASNYFGLWLANILPAWNFRATLGYSSIKADIQKIRSRNQIQNGQSINFQYTGQLNILQRSYKEVPIWWYIALFFCAFISTIAMLGAGQPSIPIWAYFVASA